MKITPDASLFQALSTNLPKVSRQSVTPAPNQSLTTSQTSSTQTGSAATAAREAARQEAIRQNIEAIKAAQRQFRDQQAALAQSGSAQQTQATAQTAPAQDLSTVSSRGAALYSREAPGTGQAVDPRPSFVKLGQILDISV